MNIRSNVLPKTLKCATNPPPKPSTHHFHLANTLLPLPPPSFLIPCVCLESSRMARRLIPLLDRILVEKFTPPVKSVGGILLPESAASSKVNAGKVIAVGPGSRAKDGSVIPLSVKEGDTVLLPEYGGNQVKLGEKEFALYREDDILGILTE